MTVHCPLCGQPVRFLAPVIRVIVADMDHLAITLGNAIIEHRCPATPPQDRPS